MGLEYKLEHFNTLQKGAFGEAFARMAFALKGIKVYTAEYDDRGVDFVLKTPRGVFYEAQVKTTGKSVNPFIYASKFRMEETFLFVAVRLTEGMEPELYVARATEWKEPNGCINFNSGGGNAGPYYEMSFAKKHQSSLDEYALKRYFSTL